MYICIYMCVYTYVYIYIYLYKHNIFQHIIAMLSSKSWKYTATKIKEVCRTIWVA